LDIDVDVNRGLNKLEQDVYRLGLNFSKDRLKIKKAINDAWQAHLSYQQLMSERGLMPSQAIASIYEKTEPAAEENIDGDLTGLTIAVVGHHYLLYDEQTNHRLVHRLRRAGCRVVTPSMLTAAQLEAASDRSANRAYWTWEEEVVGAGNCFMSGGVDGIIGVAAFGCGPDSVMMEIVRRQAMKRGSAPFMMLTLEEHTADAGILTRLEAFIDMIHRRKRRLTCA
jgi:predicted nucleotide-binding protein (sugar kinase/HSP70/actin superfamily)